MGSQMSTSGGLVGRGLTVEKQTESREQGGPGVGALASAFPPKGPAPGSILGASGPVPLKAGHFSLSACGKSWSSAPRIWELMVGEEALP